MMTLVIKLIIIHTHKKKIFKKKFYLHINIISKCNKQAKLVNIPQISKFYIIRMWLNSSKIHESIKLIKIFKDFATYSELLKKL